MGTLVRVMDWTSRVVVVFVLLSAATPLHAQPPVADPSQVGPRPGDAPATVTIDPERCCVLVNGEPLFVIGACGIRPTALKLAADAGFNTTIRWDGMIEAHLLRTAFDEGGPGAAQMMQKYLDVASDAGLWVIETPTFKAYRHQYQNDPDFPDRFDTFLETRLAPAVEAVREHPALLCYYGEDEPVFYLPDMPRWLAQLRSYRTQVHELDPHHPVYVNFGRVVRDWPGTYDIGGGRLLPPRMGSSAAGRVRRRRSQQCSVAREGHPPLAHTADGVGGVARPPSTTTRRAAGTGVPGACRGRKWHHLVDMVTTPRR